MCALKDAQARKELNGAIHVNHYLITKGSLVSVQQDKHGFGKISKLVIVNLVLQGLTMIERSPVRCAPLEQHPQWELITVSVRRESSGQWKTQIAKTVDTIMSAKWVIPTVCLARAENLESRPVIAPQD
jgi:hypothetical protein